MLRAAAPSLEGFQEDVEFLWCQKSIPVLSEPPSSLHFLRNFVSLSKPCIIKRSLQKEGKPLHMSLDELVALDPDAQLTVDATPDGHGDCLRKVAPVPPCSSSPSPLSSLPPSPGTKVEDLDTCFVQPEERPMKLSDFASKLRSTRPRTSGHKYQDRIFVSCVEHGQVVPSSSLSSEAPLQEEVLYYSRQNDCLRTELSKLWSTNAFSKSIPWAEEAFGTGPPDAINLWIGDERATSAMHKDHYENMFYVLSGEKVFTLCPPADAPFLYEREHPCGRFDSSSGTWKVERDIDQGGRAQHVRWISADVTSTSICDAASHTNNFPGLKYAHPIEVRVKAGEMLYLPALWFHQVTQTCETVGINYWFDMKFDSPQWCYFRLLQQMEFDCE